MAEASIILATGFAEAPLGSRPPPRLAKPFTQTDLAKSISAVPALPIKRAACCGFVKPNSPRHNSSFAMICPKQKNERTDGKHLGPPGLVPGAYPVVASRRSNCKNDEPTSCTRNALRRLASARPSSARYFDGKSFTRNATGRTRWAEQMSQEFAFFI